MYFLPHDLAISPLVCNTLGDVPQIFHFGGAQLVSAMKWLL